LAAVSSFRVPTGTLLDQSLAALLRLAFHSVIFGLKQSFKKRRSCTYAGLPLGFAGVHEDQGA